ncbi:MAG: hypothetical protein AB1488_05665 [Nitrospirota bacterium]
MKRIMALLISLLVIVAFSLSIGCAPKKEEKPAPPPVKEEEPAKPAEPAKKPEKEAPGY